MNLRHGNHGRQSERSGHRLAVLYAPLLLVWAKGKGLDTPQAEALVRSVLLTLMNESPTIAGGPSWEAFRDWIHALSVKELKILRQQVASERVGGSIPPPELIADDRDDPLWRRDYQSHLVRQALWVLKNRFELKTWQACWELAVNNRPADEVARLLGMSEGAVHVATARVLRGLRQELAGLWE